MRMLDVLPDEQLARRFGDYLLTRGIKNEVEPGGNGWAVWVIDDDHLQPAGAELAAFRAAPDAEQFRDAARAADRLRDERERTERKARERQVDVRTSWASVAGRATPLTIALIVLSVTVGLLTRFGMDETPGPLQMMLYLSPPDAAGDRMGLGPVLRGQVWRLVTSIFVHFGPLHLLFNMLWLADLGTRLERLRGTLWLALFVLLTAVVSNLAEHFLDMGLDVPTFIGLGRPASVGGMSGVVYGLFGYTWIRGRLAPYDPLQVSQQTTFIMIAWLVLCMTGMLGSVANVAHLVGLLAGVVTAYVPVLLRRIRR